MPVKFEEKQEIKSVDFFKSVQYEDSEDDDEECIFPTIQSKIQKLSGNDADKKITNMGRHMSLKDLGSFCDPNDQDFEVPQKIAHRGSYENFLVQS